MSGGDGGMVHVNEGVSAKNKFDGNSDEWEKGEMESAAEKFPKDNAAELPTGRGENGQHVDSGMQLRSKRKIVERGAAEQGSVRQGEEVIPGSIGELRVDKNDMGIAAEQGGVNGSLAKGESAGKRIASDIAEGISKGTAAGQAAKAFAGRPVHNSEAESVHRCAAGQGNLNMGQFTNEIAAGNLPGFQENISSIAAGQTAKTVAGRHGQGSCHNAKAAAAGQDDRVVAAGQDDRVVAAEQNDRAVAAGQNDRAVATKSGKTFNDAAAGQGCVGLDKRQDSMEAAAGQRCKVAPVGYRQHDGERMAKEAAAGEGIPGRFGELGVGEGDNAKEAAAGDGRHGRYANEAAAGDGQHGQDAKEAAG
ncbi:hypothetical protein FRX31_005380, partial [Thalictrum thalictroides]